MSISIKNAIRMFKYMPKATKWVPQQSFRNATVSFEKRFSGGTLAGYDKVVKRADGTVVTGHYTREGLLGGATYSSNRGKIETSLGAQNYDKVTQIVTNRGDEFTRLGHKADPGRYIDFYGNSSTMYNAIDDKGAMYKKLVEYVKSDSRPSWLKELIAEWR